MRLSIIPNNPIAFHRPFTGREEEKAVIQAIRQGHLGGNGQITRSVEKDLTSLFGVRHACLMNSCTAVLEACLNILDVAGGEVVLPAFAFPSSAAAIVGAGAKPVFADIEADYFTLDPDKLERVLTRHTRAILFVDYGGHPGTLEGVCAFAAHRGIPVIEDAAHALGSKVRGRPLGSWGTVGCASFHETKVVTCGEGGVFLTDDECLARAAAVYREYGTNRFEFLQGDATHYEWVGQGSSCLLAEPLAAFLKAQLDKLPWILERHRQIAAAYQQALSPLACQGAFELVTPGYGTSVNWHTFCILMPGARAADELIYVLAQQGITVHKHFCPLHRSPYARERLKTSHTLCPVTESVAGRLVRLPIYPELSESDIGRVICGIRRFVLGQDVSLKSEVTSG